MAVTTRWRRTQFTQLFTYSLKAPLTPGCDCWSRAHVDNTQDRKRKAHIIKYVQHFVNSFPRASLISISWICPPSFSPYFPNGTCSWRILNNTLKSQPGVTGARETHRLAVKAVAGLNCDESIFALYSAYLSPLAGSLVFSWFKQKLSPLDQSLPIVFYTWMGVIRATIERNRIQNHHREPASLSEFC